MLSQKPWPFLVELYVFSLVSRGINYSEMNGEARSEAPTIYPVLQPPHALDLGFDSSAAAAMPGPIPEKRELKEADAAS